ncbi:MAG: extracellular solute-binding protein [Rhodobacteraceae bacterium]|nr:extracellular solute-binding protein [Paracoccaceae bacterium]
MQTRHLLALTLLAGTTALSAPAFAADLVMYDALDFAGTVAKAFTAKTGITVDVVEPGSTGETLGKIAAEGDNPQFDILWVDGSAVFERMLQNKVVQPVPQAAFDTAKFNALGTSVIPADHAFLPTGASTTAIEVNTKKVAADKMPKSWADLTAFAGHVAAKDPNLSGPSYQWLAGFFQTEGGVDAGKKLLGEILTNKKISGFPSGGKVNKEVLAGDAVVGINQDSSIISKQVAGEPVVAVYPTEGSVALPEGLGISSKTKHMDNVMKFIDFVLSPEGQAAMQNGDDTDYYFLPVIEGVKAKANRPAINFIVLDDKTASAHETEWKQWYRDTFVQ